MSSVIPQIAVLSIGLLHVVIMVFELYPWSRPRMMQRVLKKWPRKLDLSENDEHLVAMIVHNAGIYNGIVAAGLFATVWVGAEAFPIQIVLLVGVVVAGLFGAVTLSIATILQAILGGMALTIVVLLHA